MNLTFKAKVGKKRVLVIPKKAAEILSIREGTTVKITIDNDRMIIEPIRDAIWLSLYGEKIANISLKELEEISIEEQGKIIEK
ncbi:MAG: AbrB/MazE/SpoVT family DNA-binding domain-containing protein [archaeon GB-1867-005]|nr:AbrB/MazE/SpoVT family DNA-binding domain-containing protein [Candidatus Culexmicrobium cathedralense]